MNTQNTKKKAVVHGECVIYESKIPVDAVREDEHEGKNFVIIADSEVTGNHHVIDRPKTGVEFFRKDKNRYMKNTVDTNVRCVVADRHTVIPLKAGEWQMGIAQEFDYKEMAKRNVKD